MTTLPPNATRTDMEEELSFMDVLIESLDKGADDYAYQLQSLETTKQEVERRLDAMFGSSRPQSQQGMDGAGDARDPWWQATMNGRPGSSGSANSNHVMGGAFNGSLNGNKRPLPYGLSLDAEHRSKRATPEPSNADTPSSMDSFELFGNPYDHAQNHSEKARQRQRGLEAALRRQREQEQADEQLARTLSQRQQKQPFTMASSSRPTYQTTIGHTGSFQRPPPQVKPESSYATPTYGAAPTQYTHIYNNAQSTYTPVQQQSSFIKPEPVFSGQQLPQRSRPSPASNRVIDLTASDDESDEELSEIAPTHFTPSRRPPRPVKSEMGGPVMRQMPGAYPTPYTNGSQSVYNANGATSSSRFGYLQAPLETISNAVGGIKYAASSFAGQLGEVNHLINGGSSRNPATFTDNDELVYGGTRSLGEAYADPYANHGALFRERFDTISAVDPTRTRDEIEALLENIRPDEEMPAHLRVQTPEALTITLHKYQEMGLTWLKNCEEGNNKGGILADDMGLGKTIQMISLLVTRKSDDPRCRTTLIIAPVALLRQWQQEIESKIKPGMRHRLSVLIHHGQSKKKQFRELQMYDVVITTYGSVASELKRLESFRLRQKHDPETRPRPSEQCALLSDEAYWYRVVLDEAQCIKNKNTQSAKAAYLLKAKYRFCMTGTPMMNNVDEFYSLVHFLRIKPYCHWEKFRVDFSTPLKTGRDWKQEQAMQKFQALCKAVMLRRTKKSKFEGRPILVLPERTTDMVNPEFSEDEREFYNSLEQKTRLQFNKYVAEGSVGREYSHVLVLLLRLRQAACHPHLIKDFAIASVAGVEPNDLLKLAETLAPEVVARIKEKNGSFECAICMDATTNPAIFIPCGHDACAECFARITDPANAIAAGNDEGGTKARCPNCRGPIDSKKITDFESFKRVHQHELLTPQELAEVQGDDSETEAGDSEEQGDEVEDDSAAESEEEEDDVDVKGNLKGFIVNDDEVNEDDRSDDDDDSNDADDRDTRDAGPSRANGSNPKVRISTNIDKLAAPEKSKKNSGSKKSKGKKKKKEDKAVSLADLRRLGSRNIKARKAYLRKLRADWVTSAKLEKTLETLRTIMDAKEDHEKVLIFSQWTSLLDLLEIPVDQNGWGYRRYDGGMNARERADAVDEFKTNPHLRIMLVSLKAGNAGLNLNMASHVVILDPFWNPYIEEQAIDRAHRLGQERPVKVHRMLIKETVEDRIIEIQERKRELIGTALDEKAAGAVSRLGVQELAYLFGVTRNVDQRIRYVPQNQR